MLEHIHFLLPCDGQSRLGGQSSKPSLHIPMPRRGQEATCFCQNQDLDTASPDFQTMLQGLPSGNHMPRWAKQALRDLFVWAKDRGDGPLQDRLFELRFDKQLDDDRYLNNDPNDIDTLWKLLQNLPDTNQQWLFEDMGDGYKPASQAQWESIRC